MSTNIKGAQAAKRGYEEGTHLIRSLQQLCLAQDLPPLGHQAFFRIFSAGFHTLSVLGPACDKVASNANVCSARCFNNLQKRGLVQNLLIGLLEAVVLSQGRKWMFLHTDLLWRRLRWISQAVITRGFSQQLFVSVFPLQQESKGWLVQPDVSLLSETLGSLLALFPIRLRVCFLFQQLGHRGAFQCLQVKHGGPSLPTHYTSCLSGGLIILFFFNLKNI